MLSTWIAKKMVKFHILNSPKLNQQISISFLVLFVVFSLRTTWERAGHRTGSRFKSSDCWTRLFTIPEQMHSPVDTSNTFQCSVTNLALKILKCSGNSPTWRETLHFNLRQSNTALASAVFQQWQYQNYY